jgi:hypothetical protein
VIAQSEQDLGPSGEGLVAGHDRPTALVAGADQAEEEGCGLRIKGGVPDLVDEERDAGEPLELVEPARPLGGSEPADPLVGGGEGDPLALLG